MIWRRSEGKHQWRAKPVDFKWWSLSKPQPRLMFKPRNSWYNLVTYLYNLRIKS